MYHHGINLILQTSAGGAPVPPQDTDEDDALLSPILNVGHLRPNSGVAKTANVSNLKGSTQKISANTRNNFNATVQKSENLVGPKQNLQL